MSIFALFGQASGREFVNQRAVECVVQSKAKGIGRANLIATVRLRVAPWERSVLATWQFISDHGGDQIERREPPGKSVGTSEEMAACAWSSPGQSVFRRNAPSTGGPSRSGVYTPQSAIAGLAITHTESRITARPRVMVWTTAGQAAVEFWRGVHPSRRAPSGSLIRTRAELPTHPTAEEAPGPARTGRLMYLCPLASSPTQTRRRKPGQSVRDARRVRDP
jgi:hypothetical protein